MSTLCALLLAAAAVAPDPAAEARARAARESDAGHFAEAAAILEDAFDAAPRDADLRVQAAHQERAAGHRELAAADLRAALALSPDSTELAAELDELLGPAHLTVLRLFGGNLSAPGQAVGSRLWTASLGVDTRLDERWMLGATARHSGRAKAQLALGASSLGGSQDELHLQLDFVASPGVTVGLLAAGANIPASSLGRGTQTTERVGVIGLQLRAKGWLTAEGSAVTTRYGDEDVFQLGLGASFPLTSNLDLFAGGRGQHALLDGTHAAGQLELRLHDGRWLLGLGGQAGAEVRPYDVLSRSLYNSSATLLYSAHLHAWFPIAPHLDGFASAGWERWRASPIGSSPQSNWARLTVGLASWF